MKFALEPVSGPSIEPFDLAEAKRHLREFDDVNDMDGDIVGLIKGAREWAEAYTGRVLIDQTWRLSIDQDECLLRDYYVNGVRPACAPFFWHGRYGEIWMRKSPVIAVTSVATVADDGTETVVDDATYEVRDVASRFPRLVPLSGATWTRSNLRIMFRAGYADTLGSPPQGEEVVPVRFKQAMKLWVEAAYNGGPDAQKLLDTAERLIKSERVNLSVA